MIGQFIWHKNDVLALLSHLNFVDKIHDSVCLFISLKLEETTVQLQLMAEALEKEKSKSEELLYQMLPVKVANALRSGDPFEAGIL